MNDEGTLGWDSTGLQAILPLSPIVALVLYDPDTYEIGKADTDAVPIDSIEEIEAINALQVLNAKRFLYYGDARNVNNVNSVVENNIAFRKPIEASVKNLAVQVTGSDTVLQTVQTIGGDIDYRYTLPGSRRIKPTQMKFAMARSPKLTQSFEDLLAAIEIELASADMSYGKNIDYSGGILRNKGTHVEQVLPKIVGTAQLKRTYEARLEGVRKGIFKAEDTYKHLQKEQAYYEYKHEYIVTAGMTDDEFMTYLDGIIANGR